MQVALKKVIDNRLFLKVNGFFFEILCVFLESRVEATHSVWAKCMTMLW